MICDICKKNVATIHQIVNINGIQSEKHICSVCAGKIGLDFNSYIFKNEDEFFDSFFGGVNHLDFFSNSLVSKVKVIRKKPVKQAEQQEVRIKLNGKNVKNLLNKKTTAKQNLEAKLKQAIVEERYEDASKIKEKLNSLKKEKSEEN